MGTPCLSALPEPDRTESLEKYLQVFAEHPNLADFRRLVRTRPERQLALFAALERAVLLGRPTTSPPSPDDEADQLLCDLLDVIDSHPVLKNSGAYYGPHRHLANLQALGIWRGNAPIAQPSARELFTTAFSNLNADAQSGLNASDTNNSPASQDFGPNGELIGGESNGHTLSDQSLSSPQAVDGVLVLSLSPHSDVALAASNSTGIIHHERQNPGEKLPAEPPDPNAIPAKPIRRGRPIKLDDLAKGKLLGLMSYGLSFRQAAAQLGVHHVTLLNALKRDEEFAQQVSEARLNAISQPLLTVIQASRTNWRAAAWLAKFLHDRRTSTYETTPEERELKK
jgi:hypothetical protein